MISGARRNHTAIALRLREFGNLVVGPAQFEAEDRLLILTLEPDAVAETIGKTRSKLTRCFPRAFITSACQRRTEKVRQAGGGCGTHKPHCTTGLGKTGRGIRVIRGYSLNTTKNFSRLL